MKKTLNGTIVSSTLPKFKNVYSLRLKLKSWIPRLPYNLYSEDEDPEYKPLRMPFKDDMDDFTNSPLDDKDDTVEGEAEGTLWIPPEGDD